MDERDIEFIQDRIGYKFKNKELLIQAFTRRSYSMEKGGQDNEVLEFIGDKALDLVVVKLLSEEFGHYSRKEPNPDFFGRLEDAGTYISELNEGELTEKKKNLVQKSTLADAIDLLGIADYLIMGNGDIERDMQESTSVKEDLFEAILGAIALDSNWDLKKLQDSMEVMLNPRQIMYEDDLNYVTEIQDWALQKGGDLQLHRFYDVNVHTVIYHRGHPLCIYGEVPKDTNYACEVQLPGIEIHFIGYGRSKSIARMSAAKLAYEYLEEKNLLFSIKDEIENPNYNDSIGQLEILARRGYFSIPEYDFAETHDQDGNPIWTCKCWINEKELATNGESSSKKDAKKQAAFDMLEYVLKED